MRTSLSGIRTRVNVLAERLAQQSAETDWDEMVRILQSARTQPPPPKLTPSEDAELTARVHRLREDMRACGMLR